MYIKRRPYITYNECSMRDTVILLTLIINGDLNRPLSGFSGSYLVPSGKRKEGRSFAMILIAPHCTFFMNNLSK